jgi:hypothetical protein
MYNGGMSLQIIKPRPLSAYFGNKSGFMFDYYAFFVVLFHKNELVLNWDGAFRFIDKHPSAHPMELF